MSRTTYNDRSGRPRWRASLMGALLAVVLVPALASAQSADDKYRNRNQDSSFNLAASPTAVLRVNQYQCGLQSAGQTCTDVFDSPTGGGGFWPTGSPNQYMFNSGIQVVGIVPMGDGCTTANREDGTSPDCFAWSGDTVGAFFMDASGLRQHGTPITPIFDSLDPEDIQTCGEGGATYPNCWPGAGDVPDFPFASAYVEDTTLFNDVLIGRKAASQQDSWLMYWDGDPTRTGGRTHPLGVAVEQRTLAWNYPTGNESVIYIIYKFTNVTNNALFQRLNETRYAIPLPDAGWRIDSMYVAYLSDPDVTLRYSLNYATAVLPFNLGMSYDGQFFAPEFVYPPALFHAPFFTNAPGMVGIKYLKSPIDPLTGEEVGLTSFSLTTNGGAFPDPSTVQRGWRYISLNVDPSKGDPNCTFTDPDEVRERRSCYLAQQTADVRFFVGSGPFSLDPGASATIAVAQYAAATVETNLIARGDGTSPQNAPGFPTLAPGCNGEPIRPLEIGAGYPASVPAAICPAPGEQINQYDLAPHVVPGSMLGKAMVAQAIFDNKFLLGFAPETPPFYLVPGDNQVTVVWEPSDTETEGDPFFAAAGDPDNALFDPNYREFDVEGYRIYRGTSPSDMDLVAQFDKSGSVFTDVLCVTDPTIATGEDCDDVHEVDITGDFVQYVTVARLQSGDPIVLDADTAMAEQIAAGTAVPLSNTGVPFAYVDTEVRNGFQYFYRVTAFDINSVRSGPSSLESAGPTKSVLPQAAATSLTDAAFTVGLFGRSGEPLEIGAVPAIDPTAGTFAGPMPPTNAFDMNFVAFAPQLLGPGQYAIRVDSVLPDYYGGTYHMTVLTTGQQFTVGGDLTNILSGTTTARVEELPVVSVESDPTVRADLRAQGVDAPPLAGALNSTVTLSRIHYASATMDWTGKVPGFWNLDPVNDQSGGSRWFAGANESTPDPTLGETTGGSLPGINTIFSPQPYIGMATYDGGITGDLFRRFYQTVFALHRSADMQVFWGATGIDSIVDVTHDVRVPFSTHIRASWGFIPDSDANGELTWGDITRLAGTEVVGSWGGTHPDKVPLSQTPVVLPTDVDGDLVADGSGFALYIAGEPFFFEGALPTNTVWTLRTYHGEVTHNGSTYAFNPTHRNPAVPGLLVQVNVTEAAQIVAAEADLTRIHTVPDPYYATSTFDLGPTTKELQFVNMPAEGTIRIYSLSGVLVDVINHNDPAGGGVAKWDLRNRSNQFIASGVYLYHVSTPDGKTHIGKFTVVNSGIQR